MKPPPVPSSVFICGQVYAIKLSSALSDEELGRCETTHQEIHLNPRQGADSLRDSLLHEICHALYYLTGCEDGTTEERFTSMTATGLRAVMLANPQVLKYVFSQGTAPACLAD